MKIQPPSSQANLQLVNQQTGGCWVAIQEDFIIQQTFGMEMAQEGVEMAVLKYRIYIDLPQLMVISYSLG